MSKKGCFGCSLPLVIGLSVFLLALFVLGFIAGPIGQGFFNINMPSWMVVDEPHIKLAADPVFNLFGFPITNTFIAAWITVVVLALISYFAIFRGKLVPGRFQAAVEFLFGWIYDLCVMALGEKNTRRFFPLICTIFLFVGFNAWLALIPGYGSIIAHTAAGEVELIKPANTDINLPLALAIVSFVTVEAIGLSTFGIKYLGKFFNFGELGRGLKLFFTGKVKASIMTIFRGVINAFTGVLEAISELIRLVSLTFRLFGNMTAGEILLLSTTFLIPWMFPLPFYGLELLIGFIQALIFSGLTMTYLVLALTPHGEEHT